MKTHKEALEIAVEYGAGSENDLEHMMRKYLMARDLVMAPKSPTKQMWLAGTNAIEEKRDYARDTDGTYECTDPSDQAVPCYEAMLTAAPDPFAEETP